MWQSSSAAQRAFMLLVPQGGSQKSLIQKSIGVSFLAIENGWFIYANLC
jgi:hypothetical protein